MFNLKFCSFVLSASILLKTTSPLFGIDSFSSYERAEFYYNHSLQQWSVAFEALNEYPFQGTESVLEIGCRGGRVAANLAGRLLNGDIVATEMRGAGAIEFAKKNHSQALYPNLTFLEQDFLDSLYHNQFDLAVSFSSLHWYFDQEVILQKIYEALKPNGQILFTIPAKPLPEIGLVIEEVMSKDRWKSYFSTYIHPRKKYMVDEYVSLLTKVGFEPLDIRLDRHEYCFENKRALIDWFTSFSPIIDTLPVDEREDFMADFANTYTKYFAMRADGLIPFVQDELFIRAYK